MDIVRFHARVAVHVVRCGGCRQAWLDIPAELADVPVAGPAEALELLRECACTCADESAPHYEDWVTAPATVTFRADAGQPGGMLLSVDAKGGYAAPRELH